MIAGRPRPPWLALVPALLAMCAPPHGQDIRPTMLPWDAPLPAFWQQPAELSDQNLFDGPWGAAYAPQAGAEYTLEWRTSDEDMPELIVTDGNGRRWAVAPERDAHRGHGSIEVVLSRVLSALGYHQPPVYFVPSFALRDARGVHVETGGRFRREDGPMQVRDRWSWEQNPFVGMRPYQGLLIVLLMFNASNIDSANNTLYDVVRPEKPARWYVVRDLAATLGPAGLAAGRSPGAFARGPFITGVDAGFVAFDYAGPHAALVRGRIPPDDVGWVAFVLSRLTDRQWQDAFRAGGYTPAAATRYIAALRVRIEHARRIGGDDWP